MQLQLQLRILLVFIVISASCSWNQSEAAKMSRHAASADEDERHIERLWAAALRAINEAELQRRAARPAAFEPVAAPVRMNSKRLKWRTNSKLLDARSASKQIQAEPEQEEEEEAEEQPLNDYVSTATNVQAPSYIDVSDNTPAPPPWWF